jgi:hypothetical protein
VEKGEAATYTGVITKDLESLGIDLASETLEGALEDVLRLASQDLDTLIDSRKGGDVLVLDNVGILDQAVDITGNVKRSRLRAPGRSTEDSREEGEKDRGTHDDGRREKDG